MRCDRCHKDTYMTIMSMFNQDILCKECKEKETKHPKYSEAVEAEQNAVKNGNYNFQGIGWTPNE